MSFDADASYEARGYAPECPLSISQLNWAIKNVLEQALPKVWAEGEICDLSRPSSGHIYFTLKDDRSQIRGVIWRSTAQRLPFKLEDGMSVVCCGAVEVYAPRGSYQLIVNKLQPQGLGPLQLAFQQLHRKLSQEGLFASERKRPMPRFPKRIGFVTSPSGAALHDFVEAARARWSDYSLYILPARVQGDQAAREIVAGIQLAQKLKPALDIVIVGRGGGSMEDLWCFNDERVVRALAGCKIPTISAVGHEIDVTLSDLAADVRALTPTQAAQLALPSQSEIAGQLQQLSQRGNTAIRTRVKQLHQRLQNLTDRSVLVRPHDMHKQRRQLIDDWELRARAAAWNLLRARQESVASLARATQALSPLNVLARGYSLTHLSGSQQPLRSSDEIQIDDELTTVLAHGKVRSQVISKEDSSS